VFFTVVTEGPEAVTGRMLWVLLFAGVAWQHLWHLHDWAKSIGANLARLRELAESAAADGAQK
jgi:hypothetical protein